jgi:putative Mg2+ transporter-C (MgtC) family protein
MRPHSYANIKGMLTFEQMLSRLGMALIFGMILGIERELVHKEAGARTQMLVAAGSALFAMMGLALPFITAQGIGITPTELTINAGASLVANIVLGIGFLGAGIIIKLNNHPHGVTTAADVWATAAIGALTGLGLIRLAASSALLIALLLFLIRKLKVSERLEGKKRRK